ncbi:hypothetical protein EIP91_008024 [Steccherinum ochraceum]|uniref:BTB domain-containing protein n=1 Tax=Steccherinum ochraceum TaxID=92696 RepID=A0A4R0R959_9APHY|nr:hypothetical protein EIP91_008024 [Steccherinum ochraceum]
MPTEVQNTLVPFDIPAADVIIRSCDNVDFRSLKVILSMASPVFKDMFSLPIHPNSADQHDGLPVVRVTETGTTLDNLLRLCYPICPPEMKNAQEICEALDAARKYMMERPEKEILEQFRRHTKEDPLGLYAYASKHVGWEEELRIAAKASLRIPSDEWDRYPVLLTMDVASYVRLQGYHQRCADCVAYHVINVDTSDWESTEPLYYAPCIDEIIVELLDNLVLEARHTADKDLNANDIIRRKHLLQVMSRDIDQYREQHGVDGWLIHLLEFIREAMRRKPHMDTIRDLEKSWDSDFGGVAPCRCPECHFRITDAISLLRRYSEQSFEEAIDRVTF